MRDLLGCFALGLGLLVATGPSVLGSTCDDVRFEDPVEYFLSPVGDDNAYLRCVAAGDVDADGDADVLVSDRYGEEILILLNDGEGGMTLGGSILSAGCERNRIITLVDLNGDGLLDVAAASRAGAAVFRNRGHDGAWLGFHDVEVYPSGSEPHWIDTADLDLDGDLDMLIADFGELDQETGWHVFLNHGDGTFADGISFSLGLNARCISIHAADLDGDADPDIAIAGARLNGSFIHVYDNLGSDADGAWLGVSYRMPHPVTFGACSIRSLDLELDGDSDLVIAHRSQPTLSLLVNDGLGELAVQEIPAPISIELAESVDANSDGFMDIAIVVKDTGQLRILRNDGTGQLHTEGTTFSGTHPKYSAFADLDGDGDMDAIVANSYPSEDYGSVSIHINETTTIESGCELDLDCNSMVSTGDLLIILADWGSNPGADGDVTDDGIVGIDDLLVIISAWGPCHP